ncbi:ZIP family metal transporter [Natronorubrum halophilum]|uniref:ZIP family metal transporter n=1 Tax=Natronorubrum halophilum TaxID=1702106 RepID=UPI0010C1F3C1|nr:ZIP family metal transporter [Natronorubrum halophilum]
MTFLQDLTFVLVAAILTNLAAGLGAVPFFFIDEISDRIYVVLWGLASGVMLSASLFGLLPEGLRQGSPLLVVGGAVAGVGLVILAKRALSNYEFHPETISEADFRQLVLIVGTLTVHSFPEGVAVGVAFADLPVGGRGIDVLRFTIPLLAVFVTTAIAIQNIPEGLAVAIPLKTAGLSNTKILGWVLFSSLPQPIAAVIAFYFVNVTRAVLPIGLGFAAGAMIFLVLFELLPEARTRGSQLSGGGRLELAIGLAIGIAIMSPLLIAG